MGDLEYMSCPKCGGRDVRLLPSGDFLCGSCGYRWPISNIEIIWSYKEFEIEKFYEEIKNNKIINCDEISKRASGKISADDARRVARRLLRRSLRASGLGQKERAELIEALRLCAKSSAEP